MQSVNRDAAPLCINLLLSPSARLLPPQLARKAVKATGVADLLVCPRTEGGYDAEGRELASVAFDVFKQRLPQRPHVAGAPAAAQEASNVVASQRRH